MYRYVQCRGKATLFSLYLHYAHFVVDIELSLITYLFYKFMPQQIFRSPAFYGFVLLIIFFVLVCITSAYHYSASALLAMQSAVHRGILSVRPSVRPSVTFRYCVQTNEDTIVRFSASGRTIPLVSGEVKFIRIFAGDHPQRGR